MKHWQYLRYLLLHKWYIFVEGRKLNVPLWHLLIHDLSKFRWDEWIAYVHYFYWLTPDYFYATRMAFRTTHTVASESDHILVSNHLRSQHLHNFDHAWNAHQKRNKHHWQYWVLIFDEGCMEALPMPDCYQREMLADWRAAARQNGGDVRGWYDKYKNDVILHVDTRQWVEHQLYGND